MISNKCFHFLFDSEQVAERQRSIWKPNRCTHGPHPDTVFLPGRSGALSTSWICKFSEDLFVSILILIRFQDMTVEQFRDIRAKAGGLIILLPDNLSRLSAEKRQVCLHLLSFMQ